MMLLPVAHRELLAAARRPATHRVRIGSALLASVLALVVLVFIGISGAGRQSGQFLFAALWWGVQWFAILAGTFLTADAISEERRDGTLGLLFLTDIGGFELVVGKFVAAGLNAAYGMATAFPIMATAWFLGGVTNGEFWRALLVSLNTLFVSLALGLCVSAVSRRQNRAVGATVAIQLFLQIALPLIAAGGQKLQSMGRLPVAWPLDAIDWISPAGVALRSIDSTFTRAPGDFWSALGASHALGWFLLGAAGFIAAHGWRETGAPEGNGVLARLSGQFERMTRTRWTAEKIDRNPLAALFGRGRASAWLAWGLAGISTVGAAVELVSGAMSGWNATGIVGSVSGTLGFFSFTAFRGLVAWESTMFFGEARRTGALDLALTTPLTDAEIRSAQVRHLNSMFLLPMIVLVTTDIAGGIGGGLFPFSILLSGGLFLQFGAMVFLGAWLSLTERRPLVATAKTLVFAGLLPALLSNCCIGLVIAPLVGAWANGKLRMPLREVLAGVRAPWQLARSGEWVARSHQG